MIIETQIPSPRMPWNNSPLEKNPTAEPGIKTRTSYSVGKAARTESWSGNACEFTNVKYYFAQRFLFFFTPLRTVSTNEAV